MSAVPSKTKLQQDLKRAKRSNALLKSKLDVAMTKIEELGIKQPMDREDMNFNMAVAMCLEILSEVK